MNDFWMLVSEKRGKQNIIGVFDDEGTARIQLERIYKLKMRDDIDRLDFCEEKAVLTFSKMRKTVTIRLAEY